MSLGDISWGAVLVGAAAVTVLALCAPATGLPTLLGSLTGVMGSKAAALTTMAAVGGVVGEFTSDLLHSAAHSCANLVSTAVGKG